MTYQLLRKDVGSQDLKTIRVETRLIASLRAFVVSPRNEGPQRVLNQQFSMFITV